MLKKISETIGSDVLGHNVICMDELALSYPEKFTHGQMDYKWFESEIRPFNFIYVRDDVKSISITLSPDLFTTPSQIFFEIASRLRHEGL